LLGGREEKYKKLYLKTMEDVRKWMLFRPMVPGDRDILFSAAVTTSGKLTEDLYFVPEVEHLTCFIGGMVGMGAKIFDIDGDLELAKKLADGCVWAYESMVTGIMPEGSTVVQCESAVHCPWNETTYHRFLDPIADMREIQIQEYDANKQKQLEEAEKAEKEAKASEKAITEGDTPTTDPEHKSIKSEPKPENDAVPLQKRQSSSTEDKSGSGESKFPAEEPYDQKALSTEVQLGSIATGRQAEVNHTDTATPTRKEEGLVDPLRPISHKEFVESRIKQEGLSPGFVNIRSRKYSLRLVFH
jgi:mannosyl-oligosaccharide alpha-1,2-mannosidase